MINSHAPSTTHSTPLFMSFEGIEACGKSTQIELLKKYLTVAHSELPVHFFREPGGTQTGEAIRNILLDKNLSKDTFTQILLFLASRKQLIEEKIRPLFQQNQKCLVIFDRYLDSTLVYQALTSGLDWQDILRLHQQVGIDLIPQLTFYLKIDYETSQKRQVLRNNKLDFFESKPAMFYQNLIKGYQILTEHFPERIKVIDATQPTEAIFLHLKNEIEHQIKMMNHE